MLRRRLWSAFRKLDIFLDEQAIPLALILVVLIIRLPTIAEPYWYGDEAIYLTLGNSLRAGERLYVDIIDHKTPLIYYIATIANTQFGYRMIGTAAVAVSTVAFYFLLKDFFARPRQRLVALVFFILYINLPRYEGNVPNGETFVMMFVLLGLLFFRKTRLYQSFLKPSIRLPHRPYIVQQTDNTMYLFATGAMMGLATLTKIPAVFDLAVVFVVGWFVYAESLFHWPPKERTLLQHILASRAVLGSVAIQLGVVFSGWLAMILLSIVYYFLRGSLREYIDYGLLYNFRYADSWKLNFSSPIVSFFFTLKGKVVLLASWILALTLFRRSFSRTFLFASSWMGLTLIAATLSNRPYPHYFLQVFPAMAMVITAALWLVVYALRRCRRDKGVLLCETDSTKPVVEAAGSFIIISAFIATIGLLHVIPYPTLKYYNLFFKLATKQISWEEYRDQFNPLLHDSYQVAKVLRRSPDQEIFIWGNNPILYALSGKNPVGRFTVAFHIDDFNAYDETIAAIEQKKPTFVIVMKDQQPLPGLREYLMSGYISNSDYPTMTVWRRSNR